MTGYPWKERTMTYFAIAERVRSIAFVPVDWSEHQLLFLQKNQDAPPFDGFYAPYFPDQAQRYWGCIDCEARPTDTIASKATLQHSLADITDQKLQRDLYKILKSFLKDVSSLMVAVTYAEQENDIPITRLWMKPVTALLPSDSTG
jgi:hypothetical protein